MSTRQPTNLVKEANARTEKKEKNVQPFLRQWILFLLFFFVNENKKI